MYLHLPKTGGVSLNRALIELYFDVFRPHKRRMLQLSAEASRRTAGLHGLTDEQVRDVVLHYELVGTRPVRLALGHFRYTAKIIEQLGPAWRTATVLREPTSRWLSEYYYNRHKTSPHYKTDLDLDAYLESPAGQWGGCCYVRRLVSEAPAEDSRVTMASMIAEAKQNLERIQILGLLEELEDFLRRLGDVLGRRLYVGHLNRNPAPRAALDRKLDETTLRRIAALCEPDREIYEHARHLLRVSATGASRDRDSRHRREIERTVSSSS